MQAHVSSETKAFYLSQSGTSMPLSCNTYWRKKKEKRRRKKKVSSFSVRFIRKKKKRHHIVKINYIMHKQQIKENNTCIVL